MTTQGFPVVINAFASDFWMWGATLCRVYACIGGIFGVASIMTMVVIGYDRYNVIVKGFKGTKITFGKAAIILILVWLYAALGCCPPFLGWGGYALGNTYIHTIIHSQYSTVKLGDKEWLGSEQPGNSEPFPVTNLPG